MMKKLDVYKRQYTYHLKISEKTPGIMTAEDWIAFSQLINSNTFTQYKGCLLYTSFKLYSKNRANIIKS